ncbi:hypothetical protein RB195_014619 [Necator americanus]|uniref:Uncharacterized protein n=1 Tax=Necator americanus TaxID=51031 RepID=A0ABR1E0W7_NECAM
MTQRLFLPGNPPVRTQWTQSSSENDAKRRIIIWCGCVQALCMELMQGQSSARKCAPEVELEALMEYLHACLRAKKVPPWAIWVFAACFMLIVAVLLLDYCVIRRNALGNTCCSRARPKRGTGYFIHQKRTTNMLLNV